MSKKSFGSEFVIVNDVRQILPNEIFWGGPWVHLATVKRGLKEYMAFNKLGGQQAFIEEVDPTEPGLLKSIEDENEWKELYTFLVNSGIFVIAGNNYEIKGGKDGVPGLSGNQITG